MYGQDLRTRMHLLSPQLESRVGNQQANQKSQHDQRAKTREFFVDQEVMTRNLRPGPKYVTGVVVQKLGLLSYLVEVGDGLVWRRHVDHLKELASTTTGDKDKLNQIQDPQIRSSNYHLNKQLGQTFLLLRVVMILFLLLTVQGCRTSRHKDLILSKTPSTELVWLCNIPLIVDLR